MLGRQAIVQVVSPETPEDEGIGIDTFKGCAERTQDVDCGRILVRVAFRRPIMLGTG